MANNCLVTQLKGIVNNSDLKRLGEVKIDLLSSDGTVSYANMLEIVPSGTIQYECGGDITNLQLVNSSLQPVETLPLTGELSVGRKNIIWTGSGYIKIWKKYQFTTLCARNKTVIDNIDDLKASVTPNTFGIQFDGDYNHLVELSSPTTFKVNAGPNRAGIPILKDCDFSNVVLSGANENTVLDYYHYVEAGTAFNLQGNLSNIASLEHNIWRISIKEVGTNRNFYIGSLSSLTPLCKDTCERFVIVGSTQTSNDINYSEFATWKKLRSLNYKANNTTFEWKPVFDAWNEISGYRGISVEIYLNGTYNGANIANLHHVVFNNSNSYTVTA